ncbi:glucoamylase [Legionella sp. MW5194]|uniref:glycoside hydrolase family 15 protein n=1 Tax=Legionella sp. MW5194 TaxID=2662448 RepID=UPI00193D6237|nr:glycoside hydrolase family 15 protein [Legionella sp. MW5194]QRN04089.1 glucoamylase [Legionella sp. MW5194]
MRRIFAFLLYFFITQSIAASIFSADDIKTLKKNFLANITSEGSIMASPSKANPDYYYDWTRDSAIAMDLIEHFYESNLNAKDKTRLLNYVNWVERVQHQTETLPGFDILGEPKFYMDSRPYQGPWGRPQNDGPALRALTLIRFAQVLLNHNESAYVKTHLYNQSLDTADMGAIKIDLEYTAHHWQDMNYDLWEEVYGHHFFTAMCQRKALIEGAKLARALHDNEAAVYYEAQARFIELRLGEHLDSKNILIQATLPPHPGPQKTLELDSAVMLGVLLANTHDGVYAPDNLYVKNTAAALKRQYRALFPINDTHYQAVLFGRYPGDTYDGYRNDGEGNPWYILTATMAEYYYTLGDMLPLTQANGPLIKQYFEEGNAYLILVKDYASDLNLSEQINLYTGNPQGANSLTWSYVATLRAIILQQKLATKLGELS